MESSKGRMLSECPFNTAIFINLQESSFILPSNLETIFSPALEPIEVHFEPNADIDAGTCTFLLVGH